MKKGRKSGKNDDEVKIVVFGSGGPFVVYIIYFYFAMIVACERPDTHVFIYLFNLFNFSFFTALSGVGKSALIVQLIQNVFVEAVRACLSVYLAYIARCGITHLHSSSFVIHRSVWSNTWRYTHAYAISYCVLIWSDVSFMCWHCVIAIYWIRSFVHRFVSQGDDTQRWQTGNTGHSRHCRTRRISYVCLCWAAFSVCVCAWDWDWMQYIYISCICKDYETNTFVRGRGTSLCTRSRTAPLSKKWNSFLSRSCRARTLNQMSWSWRVKSRLSLWATNAILKSNAVWGDPMVRNSRSNMAGFRFTRRAPKPVPMWQNRSWTARSRL